MEKTLSVSIAAYNAEQDIERCLNSFLNTSVAEQLELLVINDGSKDRTAEIVSGYEKRYPDIVKLVNKENGGHGSTINASIPLATGKYYKIVDSDDWVDRDGIEKLVDWLKDHDVDLVLNPYDEIDAKTGQKGTYRVPYSEKQIIGECQSIENAGDILIQMHFMTFKTELIKKMGPSIDERCFYVDTEYTIYALKYVTNFVCLNYPVYEYLLGTETQSMNMKNLVRRRNQYRKVLMSVVMFLKQNEEVMNSVAYKIAENCAKVVASNQYKIYLHLPVKAAIDETRAFDNWLRPYDKIYDGADCKAMKLVKLGRKTDFSIYILLIPLLKIYYWHRKD